ncbi:MAG: hypothetical protein KGM15_14285 [Pseudomonadota bacterium]|nr:hypothetical protein [Pseudomonadota bacterium]
MMPRRPFSPIGVAVFGVPTLFAHWGFNVVRSIVEAISGPTLHLHITSLDQLREGFGRREGGSVVLTSDLPEAELVKFVCDSDLPIVTFSEASDDLLDWIVTSRNPNILEAARFCTYSLCALARPFAMERALKIVGRRGDTPGPTISAIVEHLFPGRGEWLADSTFDHLVEEGAINSATTVDWNSYRAHQESANFSASDAETLKEMRLAIASYADLMDGRLPREIIWPPELFYRQDGRAARSAFDLTGPARILFYGPYMQLPIGNWIVRVEFEIDEAVSGVEAMTDIYINEVVTEKTFEMPQKGIFAYDLRFQVTDPHSAVQIRLFTKRSAIEGVFLPRSVRVRPGV